MPIIILKHNGTIYQRKSKGIYIMTSKGKQYSFRKDYNIEKNRGWHLMNSASLPEFMMELISIELDKLDNMDQAILYPSL